MHGSNTVKTNGNNSKVYTIKFDSPSAETFYRSSIMNKNWTSKSLFAKQLDIEIQ